jgi:hypothetical protein
MRYGLTNKAKTLYLTRWQSAVLLRLLLATDAPKTRKFCRKCLFSLAKIALINAFSAGKITYQSLKPVDRQEIADFFGKKVRQ